MFIHSCLLLFSGQLLVGLYLLTLKNSTKNMSSLLLTVFRRYVSTSVNNLKKESRPHITKPWAKPVLSVKINDIINYFKKPEALKELSEVQYIEKDDLIKSTKSFIRLPGDGKLYYLTIGGERTSKELANLIIKKECFLCLHDAKKRLAIISVECKESYAIQDCTFDTHSIVEQYEVKPFEGIKPPNVEFECIDLVDEIKDMNEILINFFTDKNKWRTTNIYSQEQIYSWRKKNWFRNTSYWQLHTFIGQWYQSIVTSYCSGKWQFCIEEISWSWIATSLFGKKSNL